MVKEAPDVNSNLANDNSFFNIKTKEWLSNELVKITIEGGHSFLFRANFQSNLIKKIKNSTQINNEDLTELEFYSQVYKAEQQALRYISRAEHSKFLLTRKLLKKKYKKEEISIALEYLESLGYIDDLRFSKAWLKNRFINKKEGRIKLEAMLASRGIKRNNIKKALDDFFIQNDENEICLEAVDKLLRQGKQTEKIKSSLYRKGFKLSTIINCLSKKNSRQNNT